MEKLPDDRLAEAYDLEGVIQAGEATVVFRGRAKASGDPVVVKVLRLSGAGAGEVHRIRFLKAVSAMIKNSPSGAPPLKDAAWGPEAAVLVFVPVPGTRLTQLSGLTPSQAAHILARAAASLQTLHDAGVAHLNLSPDNLLVASLERVYLTGLGWGFVRMPVSGAPFAAPEVRKALDLAEPNRGDVFSLAQVAVELFGAQVRYEEEEARVNLPDAVKGQLHAGQELESCLGRCLHLDPFERPATVTELREALAAAVLPNTQEEGTVRLLEVEEPASGAAAGEEEAGTVILSPEGPAGEQAPPEETAPPPVPSPPEEEPPQAPPPSARETESLPPVETPVVPAPPETPPSPPAPPVAKTHPARSRGKLLWLLVGLGAIGAIAAVTVLGLWVFRKQQQLPPATPSPVAAAARPTPVPTLPPVTSGMGPLLARGEALVAAGEWEELRQLLAGMPEGALSGDEKARLEGLRSRLAAADRDRALAGLRRAVKAGDLPALRKALRDFEATKTSEEALAPEDRHLLAQARSIAQTLNRLAQEEKAQRWEQVLFEVQNLERLVPGTREAAAAQERAAQALEQQARIAEGQGNLQQALKTLQTLESFVPARPGLAERIARLREAQARQEQLRRVLERAAQLGDEGKPEQGLALLAEVPANAGLAAEVAKLKERLAQQLAGVDAGAPTVTPPSPTFKWEYPKGQVAKVEVRASDDHGVARVTMFFRKKGEKTYRSLVMSKTSAGTYIGEIVPATHGNEDLEFYVLAEDHSGHQGLLGSPERPLEVKRKRGLFGL